MRSISCARGMRRLITAGGTMAFALTVGALVFALATPAHAQKPQNTVLKRSAEPGEKAFSLLAPEGWQLVGGTTRLKTGGKAAERGLSAMIQTVRAARPTIDFTARSDSSGSVQFRRLPDATYCDASRLPPDQAKGLAPGDAWNGLTVQPLLTAREYVSKILMPKYRPHARQVTVEEARPLPDLARAEQGRLAAQPTPVAATGDAAVVTVAYEENGKPYRERFFDLILDRGAGSPQWSSAWAMSFRAPAAEFAARETIFALMLASLQEDPNWLAQQSRGGSAVAAAAQAPLPTDQDRQTLKNHAELLADIRAAMFPSVASLERFTNPFTGESELGTLALGKYRWESGAGDVVYSANEAFNPSTGWTLGRSDWRKCKVLPRGAR